MSKELEECFKEIYHEIEYVYADKVNSKANKNWSNDIKHYDNIRGNVLTIQRYIESIEDLEEQLGCPLEVVFKALVDGIWYEDAANRMTHIGVRLDTANYECEYLLREYDNVIRFLPRFYKRTWWLKKDKSE